MTVRLYSGFNEDIETNCRKLDNIDEVEEFILSFQLENLNYMMYQFIMYIENYRCSRKKGNFIMSQGNYIKSKKKWWEMFPSTTYVRNVKYIYI